MTEDSSHFDDDVVLKKEDLLTFKTTDRIIRIDQVISEFTMMKRELKTRFTAEVARRICEKSGSHLIKLVSPRVDGEHATLRINDPRSNMRPPLLPSVGSQEIPFSKVVFRPLQVQGGPAMAVIDHILNPINLSDSILSAFGTVFGDDVLNELMGILLPDSKVPCKLGVGEFPIVFVPRAGGGDLQITPVSPAMSFMGMKRVKYPDRDLQNVNPNKPLRPHGRWTEQEVSKKLQNVSGAIGGPRVRFLATMPPAMSQTEAEIYRYVRGGSFPRWRSDDVTPWVLKYADRLDAHKDYNNQATRSTLDMTADRMIEASRDFIDEIQKSAEIEAIAGGSALTFSGRPPSVALVLLRRYWKLNGAYDRARAALTSSHFKARLKNKTDGSEVAND